MQRRRPPRSPEELEGMHISAPEDLASFGENPIGKRNVMDPRELFPGGSPGASLPLPVVWALIVFLGLIAVAFVSIPVGRIVGVIAGFFWGDRIRYRIDDAGFKPMEMLVSGVEFVIMWPKRHLDRRRFYDAYGFKPWKFARLSDSQKKEIAEVLTRRADRLDEVFEEQTDALRDSQRELTKKDVGDLKRRVAFCRGYLWNAHGLADRVAGYLPCRYAPGYKCSYKNHLSSERRTRELLRVS